MLGVHVRILLVCLDNLGDLVFSSSLVDPLVAQYPDAEWVIFCKDYAADIARCFPVKAKVIAADPWWDGSPGRGKGRIWPFLKSIGLLRKFRPDVAIVTSSNWRASAAAWATGAQKIIGFDRKKSRFFLTDIVPVAAWSKTPVTKQLRQLLSPLQTTTKLDDIPPCRLVVPTGPMANDAELPQGQYVIFHPFAGDLRRCWPLSHWQEVAALARANRLQIIWMGQAHEVQRIKQEVPDSNDDLFMEDFSKGQLLRVLDITSRARCLVGHDSGPIHFASALGIPVLGLYLPGEYPRTVTAVLQGSKVIFKAKPDELRLRDVLDAFNQVVKARAELFE